MRTFSAAIQTAIEKKRIEHQAFITFADTTTMTVGENKIWQGGFEIDRAVSGQSAFALGACVIGEFKLSLNNAYGDFDGKAWYGATIRAQFEAWSDDARTTSLGTTSLGLFDVIEVDTNGTLVKLTCYDNMYKFDIPLTEIAYPTFPTTYKGLKDKLCTATGVVCATTDAELSSMVYDAKYTYVGSLSSKPTDISSLSCRDALANMCASLGAYAYINYDGELVLATFDKWWFMVEALTDPPEYENYAHHLFTPSNMTKFSRDEEDVQITGITITNQEGIEHSFGTSGYVVVIENNWCGVGNAEGIYLNVMYGVTQPVQYCPRFRPFKATHLSDLTIEAGDNVLINDQWGNTYKSFIMHTKYSADGTQESECVAEPAGIVNGARYTGAAQAVGRLTASVLPYTDIITQFGVAYTQGAIEAVDTKVNGLITGYEDQSGSAVSLANNTWTSVQTINVTAGIWLINYGVSFASNATGYRQIALTNSSSTPSVDRTMPVVTAVSGAATNVISTALYEASGAETLHVWAIQNSGAARNCWPFIKAVKLR